jgi:hypothetical protein
MGMTGADVRQSVIDRGGRDVELRESEDGVAVQYIRLDGEVQRIGARHHLNAWHAIHEWTQGQGSGLR